MNAREPEGRSPRRGRRAPDQGPGHAAQRQAKTDPERRDASASVGTCCDHAIVDGIPSHGDPSSARARAAGGDDAYAPAKSDAEGTRDQQQPRRPIRRRAAHGEQEAGDESRVDSGSTAAAAVAPRSRSTSQGQVQHLTSSEAAAWKCKTARPSTPSGRSGVSSGCPPVRNPVVTPSSTHRTGIDNPASEFPKRARPLYESSGERYGRPLARGRAGAAGPGRPVGSGTGDRSSAAGVERVERHPRSVHQERAAREPTRARATPRAPVVEPTTDASRLRIARGQHGQRARRLQPRPADASRNASRPAGALVDEGPVPQHAPPRHFLDAATGGGSFGCPAGVGEQQQRDSRRIRRRASARGAAASAGSGRPDRRGPDRRRRRGGAVVSAGGEDEHRVQAFG